MTPETNDLFFDRRHTFMRLNLSGSKPIASRKSSKEHCEMFRSWLWFGGFRAKGCVVLHDRLSLLLFSSYEWYELKARPSVEQVSLFP
jgi:hypothetical protein